MSISKRKISAVSTLSANTLTNFHSSLTLVVAMTTQGVIGHQGKIPWHLPQDLTLFRELTLGGTLIMGRKTFSSLPGPLDGRVNLVVSRHLKPAQGRTICTTLPTALHLAERLQRPTYVIGGANLYWQTLPFCNKLVISWIDAPTSGDTFFPEMDWTLWSEQRTEQFPGFRRCFYVRR